MLSQIDSSHPLAQSRQDPSVTGLHNEGELIRVGQVWRSGLGIRPRVPPFSHCGPDAQRAFKPARRVNGDLCPIVPPGGNRMREIHRLIARNHMAGIHPDAQRFIAYVFAYRD